MTTEPTSRSIGWTAARLARHLELALATMELSTAQYRMLVQLAEGAEASTSLAKKLAVSAPSVTAVVDGLVQRDAIERTHSAEDRRRVSLALTDQGRILLDKADIAVGERLVSIAAELEDPALESRALGALGLWSEALDRHRAHRLERLAQRDETVVAPMMRLFNQGTLLGYNEELAGSPFEPIAERSHYRPPTAEIDPDASKSWIARAWPVVRTHKGIWILSLVMSFIALLTQVQVPRILGDAISEALPLASNHSDHQHLKALSSFAVLILVAIAVREVSNYIGRRCLLTTAYSFEYDLRNIIYDHYMGLSFPFYDRVSVGQLISRANSDVRAVQQYLVMAPTVLVQCCVIFVAFGEMFTVDVPLTLVVAITLPITFAIGMSMRKQMYPVSWLIQARLADVAMLVEENIEGVRVVKSFGSEQKELTHLAKAADKLQWSYIRNAYIRGTWAPAMENLPRFGLAVILLYGGYLVLHHKIAVGQLYTFQAYMVLFQPPFRQLGMVIMNGQRAAASARRIYEVLDHQPEIVNREGATDLVDCRGDVEFKDVGFNYSDGTPVLSHFNMHLRPGETVAIVGRTGAGKSTIGRLINRSYEVSEGALTVDGVDVRDYTIESLRHNVGFVFDEPFLFSVSIRDNIAYGRPDASIEDVIAAAKAADADEFIVRMPNGYDTIVGERGYTLSGGQRQRMAIARTLLINPPILVLDDATSAIDVQVEQRIHSSLKKLMGSRTTLIIAHRLATISLADRVALIEDGHVVAEGRHSVLLDTEPRYAEVLAHVVLEEEGAAVDEAPIEEPPAHTAGSASSDRPGGVA